MLDFKRLHFTENLLLADELSLEIFTDVINEVVLLERREGRQSSGQKGRELLGVLVQPVLIFASRSHYRALNCV